MSHSPHSPSELAAIEHWQMFTQLAKQQSKQIVVDPIEVSNAHEQQALSIIFLLEGKFPHIEALFPQMREAGFVCHLIGEAHPLVKTISICCDIAAILHKPLIVSASTEQLGPPAATLERHVVPPPSHPAPSSWLPPKPPPPVRPPAVISAVDQNSSRDDSRRYPFIPQQSQRAVVADIPAPPAPVPPWRRGEKRTSEAALSPLLPRAEPKVPKMPKVPVPPPPPLKAPPPAATSCSSFQLYQQPTPPPQAVCKQTGYSSQSPSTATQRRAIALGLELMQCEPGLEYLHKGFF